MKSGDSCVWKMHRLRMKTSLFLCFVFWCIDCQRFSLDKDGLGHRLVGNVLGTRTMFHLPRCAKECMFVSECVSFNFQTSTGLCELLNVTQSGSTNTALQQDTAFIHSEISSWPQQMAAGCAGKPCGRDEICLPYRTTYSCVPFLSNSSLYPEGYKHIAGFILKIIKDVNVTYNAAERACAETGALVKIDTPTKQENLRTYILNGNNDLLGQDYWIQCRYYNTSGIWRFDDGTAMPMDNTYWNPGAPDFMDRQHCCRLKEEDGYFWNNMRCMHYTHVCGYICEYK